MKEKKRQKINKRVSGFFSVLFTENRNITILVLISFILTFGVIVYGTYSGNIFNILRLSGFNVGEKAPRDLVADRNFTFIDEKTTEKRIQEKIAGVHKIFMFDDQKVLEINKKFEEFSEKYTLILKKKDGSLDDLKEYLPKVSSIELDFLMTKVDPAIVIPAVLKILDSMLLKGIVRMPENETIDHEGKITIWRWNLGNKEFKDHDVSSIITMSSIDKVIENNLIYKNFPEKEKYAIHLLIRNFIDEDVYFDSIQTAMAVETAIKEVEPVTVTIKSGDKIITKGTLVTEKQLMMAKALNTSPAVNRLSQSAASFMYLLMLYGAGYFLIFPALKNKKRKNQFIVLILIFLFAFMLITTAAVYFTNILNDIELSFIIPAALFSMSLSVTVGFTTGGLFALMLALFLLLFPSTSIYGFLFTLISGFAGAYFVRKSEKRIDLIKAASYLTGVNIVVILIITLYMNRDYSWFLKMAGIGVLNAVLCSILNLSMLPVLEHIMNLPTAFRLVELSDMSMPIFKRMITLAPGTYGHSMSVANLAESAARDIGANALLARVGAYYHDIGKIDQPEYFIENQKGDNKHDDLKPSLSVAVIKSHVKIGIERGKEMGLPPEIIDIIAQHHGSGVINYFYAEAVKKEHSKKISREDYSYNNTPPESKEAGIVMLADSVEAASRVLKKPTIAKLDKYIWGIIIEKLENGQLINCGLTFKELLKIKNSFIQILAGHFHSRIEYPKLEEDKQ